VARVGIPGYAAHAGTSTGQGGVLVAPNRFRASDSFDDLWSWARGQLTGESPVVLSDGPVPGDCDLTVLHAAAGRER
jgi:hypothetical protein